MGSDRRSLVWPACAVLGFFIIVRRRLYPSLLLSGHNLNGLAGLLMHTRPGRGLADAWSLGAGMARATWLRAGSGTNRTPPQWRPDCWARLGETIAPQLARLKTARCGFDDERGAGVSGLVTARRRPAADRFKTATQTSSSLSACYWPSRL